jgi:photosystem II stability/assembly factor-like uncharacterized protein
MSWVNNLTTAGAGLVTFFFIDNNTGWVTGNKTMKSTDGGINWNLQDSAGFSSRSIYFIDHNTGWIAGSGGQIRKTTTGGNNWVNSNSGVSENINSIFFVSAETGFACGDWGQILKTTNGGNNWQNTIHKSISFFQSVYFTDSQTGYICGTGGYLIKTTNGCENWNYTSTNSFSNFYSVSFISSNTGFAFGSFGTIMKTTDGAASWQHILNSGIYSNIRKSAYTPGNNIWIAADSGYVYNSTNLGLSWLTNLKQYKTFQDLFSVHFINSQTGWTCGSKGTVLKTTNSGNGWFSAGISSGQDFKFITFLNANTGYLLGDSLNRLGRILYTSNGGNSWQQIYSDTAGFYSAYFLNSQTGWVGASKGIILKTTNGGLSWVKYFHIFNTSIFLDIHFINSATGFIARQGSPGVFKSTNGGVDWEAALSFSSGSIDFVNSSTGFILGISSNSGFGRTTNSGIDWVLSTMGGTYYALDFISSEKGWAVGGGFSNHLIRYTTNSGINWVQQNANISVPLRSVFFINEYEGWVVGFNGTIIHTTTSGIGIQQISSNIPKDFKLLQNYPNPFNPATKIRFNISKPVNAKIIIYDIVGRELNSFFYANLKPGEYQTEWDGSNYASGIYFCSLTAGDYTETRKMVLVK